MVIRYNDILTLVTTLGDQEGLRVTATESAKGGLIAGAACALGGLLMGPAGLAVGGAVGGCVAAYMSSGKFKSVSSIILEDMTADVQRQLVDTVQEILSNVDAGDAESAIDLDGVRTPSHRRHVMVTCQQHNRYPAIRQLTDAGRELPLIGLPGSRVL